MGNCCRGGSGTRSSDVKVKEGGASMEGASPISSRNDYQGVEAVQLEHHNGTGQEYEADGVEVTALQHIADREGIYESRFRGMVLVSTHPLSPSSAWLWMSWASNASLRSSNCFLGQKKPYHGIDLNV